MAAVPVMSEFSSVDWPTEPGAEDHLDEQTKEFLVALTRLETKFEESRKDGARLERTIDELADRMDTNADNLTQKIDEAVKALNDLPEIKRRLAELETARKNDGQILADLVGYKRYMIGWAAAAGLVLTAGWEVVKTLLLPAKR
jgi:septal ring factor EnvC (AmiA/AmiB activator)